MTTLREYYTERLFRCGLLDKAVLIMDCITAVQDSMHGRWDDSISHYPDTILAPLWLSVKAAAVAWLDANAPLHWARAGLAGA